MSKKKHSTNRQRQNLIVQIIAGVGLILVGVALVLLLRPRAEIPAAPQSEEWSVQPAAVKLPAPELSLVNIDGETKALSDYRQNVVLVNNWATWCPPCKAEMPTLVSFYEDHAAEGLMVIAVEAGESRSDVLPFIEKYGMKFQVWLDPRNAAMSAFRNSNLPSSYVIDRTGTVRYAWTGAISREMLEKYVTPLLSESD
jgi:cytochrome c biogenesis protein CcmG, thiol:disulfide interchange protein DsbE